MDWFIVLREVCYYFLYIGDYIFEIEIIFANINSTCLPVDFYFCEQQYKNSTKRFGLVESGHH
jgi:hypothetical protein